MKDIPYLTQYCNLSFEWKTKGITIDNATDSQIKEIRDLRDKAVIQSGLTHNELTLIALCRRHGILMEVNTYARRYKNFITGC